MSAHQISALIAAEPMLSRYLEVSEVTAGSLMATKRGRHLVKLYDADVESALRSRVGPDWGGELARRPGFTYAARSRLTVNDPQYAFRLPARWPVPDRVLRVHHDVVCGPGQLVIQDNAILPWSFHHPLAARRHARGTTYVNNAVAALPDDFDPADELDGIYFHLDSEFPGHFGHFVTEDLSRLWGWKLAKERYPGCRLLIGTGKDAEDLKPFQRTLLGALGIDQDDIRTFREPVRVATLIGATPQFHNRRYLDPDLSRIWDQLRAVLRPESTADRAQRIFVTRDREAHRQCRNADEVEEIFVQHGFKVLRPETMSIPDQIAIFAAAQVIAGYGGSGMLSMIYSDRPGVRIVIGSDHYTASNEYLIASVRGDSYHHFWCPALTKAAEGEWSSEAFHSDFVFDTAKDGDNLHRLLEGL
jgi:capsular polysaccharide biosynthesis protein